MKEDFLHYIWRHKRFDLASLKTTEGEPIQILNFGTHNHHAGPDFTNAKVQIGETIWAGNIEIHLQASDWLQHNHQNDSAYNNVILHVVLDEDRPVFRATGERIPCLELKRRIPKKVSKIYQKLVHNEYWIPCQNHFHQVPEVTRNLWLDRLLVERLEQKTALIEQRLKKNKGNWEDTFYQYLARNFGFRINNEPFESLAISLPHLILAKHRNNLFQIEALLFGQAGFLDKNFEEEYPNQLKQEYHFLQKKYSLSPIASVSWKFLRLRPANFPTIRIAQFGTLIAHSTNLFSKVLETDTLASIDNLLNVQLSDYWLTHYTFDKISKFRNKSLGKLAIQLLIINTIVPFLFLYGSHKGAESYKQKAFKLLEELPKEKNTIIAGWENLGVKAKSAYESQALLQLKNEYCDKKQCLKCAIGNGILT